jgi:formyltetrahydrofolate deformylase
MRMKLDMNDLATSRETLERQFADFASPLKIRWNIYYSDVLQRMAILVTKASHCLFDLLIRCKEGEIQCEIPLIISNHPDLGYIAEDFQIPYHYLTVTNDTRMQQESQMRRLLGQHGINLVVLARYMQVLSQGFVEDYSGRIINIHHAFLPAFQGRSPYSQAYERGVKMIGATAHYATIDLDEGPIIEQDVERVSHEDSIEEMVRIGKDIERVVLSRAVKAHMEHRTILSGRRVVVFSTGI